MVAVFVLPHNGFSQMMKSTLYSDKQVRGRLKYMRHGESECLKSILKMIIEDIQGHLTIE